MSLTKFSRTTLRWCFTVGVKLLPPVVSGGFLGQVKSRGVLFENMGFALGFNTPRVFRRICWTGQTAWGSLFWHPWETLSQAFKWLYHLSKNRKILFEQRIFHELLSYSPSKFRQWKNILNVLKFSIFWKFHENASRFFPIIDAFFQDVPLLKHNGKKHFLFEVYPIRWARFLKKNVYRYPFNTFFTCFYAKKHGFVNKNRNRFCFILEALLYFS